MHVADERNHVVPRLHSTVGKKKVNHYTGFLVPNRSEVVFDLPQFVDSFFSRCGQPGLRLRGIVHLLPKDVGLRVVDVRVIVDKLVDGAVRLGLPRLVKTISDDTARRINFRRAAISAKDVRKSPQGSHVERQLTTAFRKTAGSCSMGGRHAGRRVRRRHLRSPLSDRR